MDAPGETGGRRRRGLAAVLVATFLALVAATLCVPAVPGPLVTDRADGSGGLDLGDGTLTVEELTVPAQGPTAVPDAAPAGPLDYRDYAGRWLPPWTEWVWIGRVLSPRPYGLFEDGAGRRSIVRRRWDIVTPALLLELLVISALGGLAAMAPSWRLRLRRAAAAALEAEELVSALRPDDAHPDSDEAPPAGLESPERPPA